jgi:hypothetical protein
MYLATELKEIFETWYNRKLKFSVYPQYKEICAVESETVKAKPKGSAYDELSEMMDAYDTTVPVFIENKENMSVDAILAFIGTKVIFDEE